MKKTNFLFFSPYPSRIPAGKWSCSYRHLLTPINNHGKSELLVDTRPVVDPGRWLFVIPLWTWLYGIQSGQREGYVFWRGTAELTEWNLRGIEIDRQNGSFKRRTEWQLALYFRFWNGPTDELAIQSYRSLLGRNSITRLEKKTENQKWFPEGSLQNWQIDFKRLYHGLVYDFFQNNKIYTQSLLRTGKCRKGAFFY